jgi:hypothetical protein
MSPLTLHQQVLEPADLVMVSASTLEIFDDEEVGTAQNKLKDVKMQTIALILNARRPRLISVDQIMIAEPVLMAFLPWILWIPANCLERLTILNLQFYQATVEAV